MHGYDEFDNINENDYSSRQESPFHGCDGMIIGIR